MNVFVVGTGRCGTVTFSKACRHITNFTCRHEKMAGRVDPRRLQYPRQHIEVDPPLSWMIGLLMERYPDAFYVHLQRRKEEVVRSWQHRGIQPHRGAAPLVDVICQTTSRRLPDGKYLKALGLLYEVVNANLRMALAHVRSMHIWLHEAKKSFRQFWHAIAARGDEHAANAEFDRRYNASRP